MRSIKYHNTSKNPEPYVDIVWLFRDGNTGAQGAGGEMSTTGITRVNLIGVNNAPTASDNTVTVFANSTYAIKEIDFGFFDHEDGDSLTAVRINTLPAKGVLRYAGALIFAGLEFTADDLSLGLLTFTPDTDDSGVRYASIDFQVKDSAGLYSVKSDMVHSNKLTFDVIP